MTDQSTGSLSPFLKGRRLHVALPFVRGRVLDFGCGSGAIADFVPADRYYGFDIAADYVEAARRLHPEHRFETTIDTSLRFDTVVALAVIEHLEDPMTLIDSALAVLDPGGRLVFTTPQPSLEWAHAIGGRVGLFSSEAHDEHQTHLRRKDILVLAERAGMTCTSYKRFLLGANQLAVFERSD